ncbi:hypothetical protein TRFO_12146 [Tritrichomonas foetus]|uniref:SPIN90/Ldb17 leucine-rich domain-containing protein n=1 Tax=Tritrichomonas foetus TaxID=1144522 RepID=A0A1J4J0N0_9EUKA|nr:hypothetical protein TRFO_12146 [Tritrichomonas foetus]|eukprot:OHS92962.1 hypothetical protein TRFO_12146 [Tritrichomonas foetus]
MEYKATIDKGFSPINDLSKSEIPNIEEAPIPITTDETFQRISNDIEILQNPETPEDEVTNCLQDIAFTFDRNVYGNIDTFLEQTNTIPILLDHLNSSTEDCLMILNTIAIISKESKISCQFIQNYLSRIKPLMRSPDLLPPIVAILCFTVDTFPQIMDQLIVQNDMISSLSDLANKIIDPKFLGAILSLIHTLLKRLEFVTFDPEKNQKIMQNLQQLINFKLVMIQPNDPKDGRVNTNEVLNPLLSIIDQYMKYYVTPENFEATVTKEMVDAVLFLFYESTTKYDATGTVLGSVLAVMNRFLFVAPPPILQNNPGSFIFVLLKYFTHFSKLRLKLLFILSNIVQFPTFAEFIIKNHCLRNVGLYEENSNLSFSERENLFIIIFHLLSLYPSEMIEDMNEQFFEFMEDAFDIAESTTTTYFSTVFLNTIYNMLSKYPESRNMFSEENLVESLRFILTSTIVQENAEKAQSLLDTFFDETQ